MSETTIIKENEKTEVSYSLRDEWYQGVYKSGFTAALNIADDNCQSIGCKTLLKEAQHCKGGFTDEQIDAVEKEMAGRLRKIRNYFSHFYHTKDCLKFEEKDNVKEFLESTFKTAVTNAAGGIKESDYKGVELDLLGLFETVNGSFRITATGVIFLASFFCHRSNVYRMLGNVKGFKRTDKAEIDDGQRRDYNFTRKVLSYYSLRDSYSVKADQTRTFRELLGYLSRVPQRTVDWLHEQNELTDIEEEEFFRQATNTEKSDSEDQKDSENDEKESKQRSLRKTNKFMLFAMKFIEDWAKEKKLDVTFARYRKVVTVKENKNQDGKQVREVKFIDKIKEILKAEENTQSEKEDGLDNAWPYYIRNDHAIIRIQIKDKDITTARISENELKYLVLLIFEGKGWQAISKLNGYIFAMRNKITKAWPYNPNEERHIPSFVKHPNKAVTAETVRKRLDYIRGKIQETKNTIEDEDPDSHKWLMFKGEKISIILKFIADSITDIRKRPDVKGYNELRDLLQRLEFTEFYKKLAAYVSEGGLNAALYDKLNGTNDISELCKKVCDFELKKLQRLEEKGGSELCQYIGLEPQEKHEKYAEWNSQQAKAKRFLESQFSIGQNMLRETFYPEHCGKQQCIDKEKTLNTSVPQRKSLAGIIKDTCPDIRLLHDDRWYLMDKNPKDYDRKTGKTIRQMCNTWVQDILCMRMARWYYEKFSPALKQKIKWDQAGRGYGYERYKLLYKTDCGVTIEFRLADLTRLDILEKLAMVEHICRRFVRPKGVVSWHVFTQRGLCSYRKRQAEAIRSVFAFEEDLKIPAQQWQPQGHIPFSKSEENQQMRFHILETAAESDTIKSNDKESLRQVRNDFFHEDFKATDEQIKVFERCMPNLTRKKQRN